MKKGRPYAETRLAQFVDRRILELRNRKTQMEIAVETGYRNVNMLTMVKQGTVKLALDRVPALALALETDPRHLLRLALEQDMGSTAARAIDEVIGTVVSQNELGWLTEIRAASGDSDPALTARSRAALRAIFAR